MAVTPVALFRGAASTSNTTLYTTPTGTTTVTNIAVCNTAATAATFTILFDGVAIQSGSSVPANTTVYVDMKQVITNAKVISGSASATTVNFHISGTTLV